MSQTLVNVDRLTPRNEEKRMIESYSMDRLDSSVLAAIKVTEIISFELHGDSIIILVNYRVRLGQKLNTHTESFSTKTNPF